MTPACRVEATVFAAAEPGQRPRPLPLRGGSVGLPAHGAVRKNLPSDTGHAQAAAARSRPRPGCRPLGRPRNFQGRRACVGQTSLGRVSPPTGVARQLFVALGPSPPNRRLLPVTPPLSHEGPSPLGLFSRRFSPRRLPLAPLGGCRQRQRRRQKRTREPIAPGRSDLRPFPFRRSRPHCLRPRGAGFFLLGNSNQPKAARESLPEGTSTFHCLPCFDLDHQATDSTAGKKTGSPGFFKPTSERFL